MNCNHVLFSIKTLTTKIAIIYLNLFSVIPWAETDVDATVEYTDNEKGKKVVDRRGDDGEVVPILLRPIYLAVFRLNEVLWWFQMSPNEYRRKNSRSDTCQQ